MYNIRVKSKNDLNLIDPKDRSTFPSLSRTTMVLSEMGWSVNLKLLLMSKDLEKID